LHYATRRLPNGRQRTYFHRCSIYRVWVTLWRWHEASGTSPISNRRGHFRLLPDAVVGIYFLGARLVDKCLNCSSVRRRKTTEGLFGSTPGGNPPHLIRPQTRRFVSNCFGL